MPESIHAPEPPLNQQQREAIFDFLLLGMYADSVLKLSENTRLYDLMASVGWDSYQEPRDYSELATARVRAAVETEAGTQEFIQKLNDRLETEEARNFALILFFRLTEADQDVNVDEDKIYAAAKATFGI
jgi:hypothetical protein